MRVFEFEDFNEAYRETNLAILKDPTILDSFNISMGGMHNVIINTKSTKCDEIDIAMLGYKSNKWQNLMRTYLGKDKIHSLRSLGVNASGTSCAFDFLRHDHGNGGCIREFVLTREHHKQPWTRVTIFWRSAELHKKWAVDLILMHRILERIPNCEIKEVSMVFAYCYQSVMYSQPVAKYVLGFDPEQMKSNTDKYSKNLYRILHTYYEEDRIHPMANGKRTAKLYKDLKAGIIPEPITVDHLHLPNI